MDAIFIHPPFICAPQEVKFLHDSVLETEDPESKKEFETAMVLLRQRMTEAERNNNDIPWNDARLLSNPN